FIYDLSCYICFFFLILRLPLRSTLFPYTTLFRSRVSSREGICHRDQTLEYGNCRDRPRRCFPWRRQRCCEAYRTGQTCCPVRPIDRKSTRLNSSHVSISYAVFCLKKKKTTTTMKL